MKKPLHPVSDHAVIRYLECVQGIDVDALRCEIGQKVDQAMTLGAAGAVVGGFVYKIVDGMVTTVVVQNRPDRRTGRVRKDRSADDA